ncbi:hypothetical protein FHT87_005734 [Rhizobium sp. BK316]|nr:hypothetical protein [Rhizobium sp. BK316]
MRGILLWSLGIPIPAIIHLHLFREIPLIPEIRREALIRPSSPWTSSTRLFMPVGRATYGKPDA